MKKFFLALILMFNLSAVGAWEVVDAEQYQGWELVIEPEDKATGEDAQMWQHIKALMAILEKDNAQFCPDIRKELLRAKLDLTSYNHRPITLPENIAQAIEKLTFLKVLRFSGCTSEDLSVALGGLTDLYELQSYGLTGPLPENIGRLQELVILDIMVNGLTELPNSITALQKLEVLHLRQNQLADNLEQTFEQLGQLPHLQYIDLRQNNIQVLPANVNLLRSLKSLDLCGNALTALPRSILELATVNGGQLENISLVKNAVVEECDDHTVGLTELRSVFGADNIQTKYSWQ